ncbi:MAG: hypothetical protein ACI9FJ_001494, partial [Alteromonadaceae bacterium]
MSVNGVKSFPDYPLSTASDNAVYNIS